MNASQCHSIILITGFPSDKPSVYKNCYFLTQMQRCRFLYRATKEKRRTENFNLCVMELGEKWGPSNRAFLDHQGTSNLA